MKDKILQELELIDQELIDLSTYIYENPELGFEESKSSQAHINLLKKHGFQLEENYLGFPTAFRATYDSKKPGPTIAYLVEYDALPGIGHGCGHNILGTTSSGAGIVLKKLMEELGGQVHVLGSPAEETSGVKVDMVQAGSFDSVDLAMMAHPDAGNQRSGSSLDLYPVEFTFRGQTSHASSAPEKGINALDACIATFNNINALREHLKASTRIHGVITNGGEAANIVPDLAVAQFYVRTPEFGYIDELYEKVINCARAGALATGASLEIKEFEKPYQAMVTNESLSNIFHENFLDIGAGDIKDKVLGGSIDMGNVSQVCPAIHPYFSISNEDITAHTIDFAQATVKPAAYQGMRKAIYALVKTGVDIIEDENLLKQIQEEFRAKFNK